MKEDLSEVRLHSLISEIFRRSDVEAEKHGLSVSLCTEIVIQRRVITDDEEEGVDYIGIIQAVIDPRPPVSPYETPPSNN